MTEHLPPTNAETSALKELAAKKHRRSALGYGLAAATVLAILLWSLLMPGGWSDNSAVRADIPIGTSVYHVTERQWRRAFKRSMTALSQGERIAIKAVERDVKTHVSEAFELPRKNIKRAADWYYSVPGHFVRMGAPLGVDVAKRVAMRIFPEDEWGQKQADLIAMSSQTARRHGESAVDSMMTKLHAELAPTRTDAIGDSNLKPVSIDFHDNLLLQWLQNDPALERQGIAVVASVASSAAARQAAKAAATRAAARTGAAKGSVACAGTGPIAWACVASVFTATLIASEIAIVTIDEAMNRDDFEAMLVAEVDRLELQVTDTLRTALVKGLSEQFKERRATINWQVRPIDLVFSSASKRPEGGTN